MSKKIITIYFFLMMTVIANASEFPICKDYYSIKENEKTQKEKFLEKVLKSEPQNVECMLKLASVYFRTGKVSQGFDLITVAYKLDPKFVKKAKISQILDLALRMSRLRQEANEKKDYKIWNELADTYFDIGIFKEAAIAYEHSIEINPNQPYKMIILAISYGNLNQYKKAAKILQIVLNTYKDNFYANYYYAKLLKNEFEDRAWVEYMKNAKKLIDNKMAKFNNEQEREYIKEDIDLELQD